VLGAPVGAGATAAPGGQPRVVHGGSDCLREVTADSIIDYCPIYDHIQIWRARPHTELIETLVSELLEICFRCRQGTACKVSVTKLEVLDQALAVGVETCVNRRDHQAEVICDAVRQPVSPTRRRRLLKSALG
jgi:hypothetical protein